MDHHNLVTFDTDLIPDVKVRRKKEALELFRRASNLNDAANQLDLEVRIVMRDPMQIVATKISIEQLKIRVEELIEDGIKRYMEAINGSDKVKPQGSFEYIEPDRKG